jgi:hypothetical protein
MMVVVVVLDRDNSLDPSQTFTHILLFAWCELIRAWYC